jgi:hypothetical protein
MDTVFQNAVSEAPAVEAGAQSSEKKAKLQAMKSALRDTVQSNPEFAEKLRRLSASLKVVNTLGYGAGGNIVLDKNSKGGDRQLKPTSQIVGYSVQNIGSEAIEYTTEVWTKGEDGKYTSQVVSKTFAPGETINLTRQYMTMFCAQPEISFTLSNGKIVASSRKGAKSLKEELSSYYFSFNKGDDDAIRVNDDEVKLAVDVDGVVKPEYTETFGYLNNPKETRAAKAKGKQFTTQDLAANYIATLLREQGVQ